MEKLNSRKNSTRIVIGIGIIFIILILINQFSNNPTNHETRIIQIREQKNLSFKNSPRSPIPQEEKASFEKLKYFPIDKSYAVEAILDPAIFKDTLKLMINMAEERLMINAGKIKFQLKGKDYELSAFEVLGVLETSLFIPFTDETSGAETYGAGRYLDIPPDSDPLIIDFNLAYSPDCAYNPTSSCPIPPRENHLPLTINVGEMTYKE